MIMFRLLSVLLTFTICLNAKVNNSEEVLKLFTKKSLNTKDQQQLKDFVARKLKKVDLTKANHRAIIHKSKDGGGTAAWFMKADSKASVVINAEKGRSWKMRQIGNSGLFFTAAKFANMSSVHFRYTVNGYRFPMGKAHRFGFESYTWGKMSLKQKNVPQGKLIPMGTYKASDEFYKGTERDWWVYVPSQYKSNSPSKLLVVNDGAWYIKGDGNVCTVIDNLIHAGKMPVTIAVFINPGVTPSSDSQKQPFRNRSNEYDTCTSKYADFLEKEIISQLYSKYNISKKAEDHAIFGSSSGASCAFSSLVSQ